MKEPYKDVTHLPFQSELTNPEDVVHLMGNEPKSPVKAPAPNPSINMSEYQQMLLEEIKKRPPVASLLAMIFNQYPQIVTKEFRQTSHSASPRQRKAARQTVMDRLTLEVAMEESICKLAGIDLNALQQKASGQEATLADVSDAVDEEIENEETVLDIKPIKKVSKKVSKKVLKKATSE